jgi:16S rRNA (cytosine1402-N4)-methyltransferase
LLVIDQDPAAIAHAQQLAAREPRLIVRQGSFKNIDQWVSELGARPDGVLLDLGVSSPQLDDAERGFSFLRDGPLDMRMDTMRGQTAAQWLAETDEKTLADVLWRYGEEKLSRRIARAVVKARERAPIVTTKALADLVSQCYPQRPHPKHPATRTFQAIRIHINEELAVLSDALIAVARSLAVSGRVSIISFHSLEDRIVKQFLRDYGREDLPEGLPLPGSGVPPLFKVEGKKIKAQSEELTRNPRARSAVLRVATKTRELEKPS